MGVRLEVGTSKDLEACLASFPTNFRVPAPGERHEAAHKNPPPPSAHTSLHESTATAREPREPSTTVRAHGDEGGGGGEGRGGGGGAQGAVTAITEMEQEEEVRQWWRGRALLRLALFADDGHIEDSTSQRRVCMRNIHVSSFLGVECAECTSQRACVALARLPQGKWWGSCGDVFISSGHRSAVHVPFASLAARRVRGGDGHENAHSVERARVGDARKTRDRRRSERGDGCHGHCSERAHVGDARETKFGLHEQTGEQAGGTGKGVETDAVGYGCDVVEPVVVEEGVADGGGGGMEARDRVVEKEDVEVAAGLDAFLWEATWLHWGAASHVPACCRRHLWLARCQQDWGDCAICLSTMRSPQPSFEPGVAVHPALGMKYSVAQHANADAEDSLRELRAGVGGKDGAKKEIVVGEEREGRGGGRVGVVKGEEEEEDEEEEEEEAAAAARDVTIFSQCSHMLHTSCLATYLKSKEEAILKEQSRARGGRGTGEEGGDTCSQAKCPVCRMLISSRSSVGFSSSAADAWTWAYLAPDLTPVQTLVMRETQRNMKSALTLALSVVSSCTLPQPDPAFLPLLAASSGMGINKQGQLLSQLLSQLSPTNVGPTSSAASAGVGEGGGGLPKVCTQAEMGVRGRDSEAGWETAMRLWSVRGCAVLQHVMRCYLRDSACSHLIGELLA
jgi:hypothetical protein